MQQTEGMQQIFDTLVGTCWGCIRRLDPSGPQIRGRARAHLCLPRSPKSRSSEASHSPVGKEKRRQQSGARDPATQKRGCKHTRAPSNDELSAGPPRSHKQRALGASDGERSFWQFASRNQPGRHGLGRHSATLPFWGHQVPDPCKGFICAKNTSFQIASRPTLA